MSSLSASEKAGAAGTAADLVVANSAYSTISDTPKIKYVPVMYGPVTVRVRQQDVERLSLLTLDQQNPEYELAKGDDLLSRVMQYASRFIAYPSRSALVAHVLWIAHAHLMDAWFSTPRLAVLSPEPGSGKSRVLEISGLLVPRPILAAVSSAAYVIRKMADQGNRPTILLDEVDAIFGPKAKGNEELRAAINAGYRRGATVGRCLFENNVIKTVDLPVYGAVALGGLGNLPGTIMSRSIVIKMRKRSKGESVEPFRPSLHEDEGLALSQELSSWALIVEPLAELHQALLPDGIEDRQADIWSPLLTVADLAGGSWPQLARAAACEFVFSDKTAHQPSLGVQLLADVKRCFGSKDRLSSAELIAELLSDEEAPWGDIRGRKLNPRELALLLKEYGISSASIRMPDGTTPKGYRIDQFADCWRRYLPGLETPATAATTDTATGCAMEIQSQSVSEVRESSATVARRVKFADP